MRRAFLIKGVSPEARVFAEPFLILGVTIILISFFIFVRKPIVVMYTLSAIFPITLIMVATAIGLDSVSIFDVDWYFDLPFAYTYVLLAGYILLGRIVQTEH